MDPMIKLPFQPTYVKENGLYVINVDSIKLPFKVKEKSIISLPPKQVGGNHRHPRIEAFMPLTNTLQLIWQSQNGIKQEEHMQNMVMYIISPNVPHVVINTSETETGVLFEYANEIQHEVKTEQLVFT